MQYKRKVHVSGLGTLPPVVKVMKECVTIGGWYGGFDSECCQPAYCSLCMSNQAALFYVSHSMVMTSLSAGCG